MMKKIVKRTNTAIIFTFLAIIIVLMLISFFDTDKTVSLDENRELAAKPKFSLHALFDRSYTRDLENYYADTFPFRSFFMSLNGTVKGLFQRSNADNVTLVTGNDTSGGSNDTVVQETVQNTNIASGEAVNTNGCIVIGDAAMELYGSTSSANIAYANSITNLAKNLEGSAVTYSIVVPTAIEFNAPEKYKSLTSSQKDAIDEIYSNMEGVVTIDAYSGISQHLDEYLYFRTDHHWTARGAYYAYSEFAKQAGSYDPPLDSFTSGKAEGFVGTMYQFTKVEKLKKNPDYVEYFEIPGVVSGKRYEDASMSYGTDIKPVNPSFTNGNEYGIFMEGDHPVAHIKGSVKSPRKILLVKDSYGNAFAPFLLLGYSDLYVIDPRSFHGNIVSFVQDNGIGEVIFLNYTFAMTNPTYMNGLNSLLN